MLGTPKYLTAEQVSAVIQVADSLRNRALLAVMYNCGLRRGEAGLLTRDDFFMRGDHGVMRVHRLKRDGFVDQEVALWRRTTSAVKRYLDGRSDYHQCLFLSNKMCPMTGQAVYYVFRKCAVIAGIPGDLLHPHVMRHSIAVHLMNMGVDIADVQEHLGHDSIDSTLVYAKVLNPRKTRTSAMSEVSVHFARW